MKIHFHLFSASLSESSAASAIHFFRPNGAAHEVFALTHISKKK
jgi:hypothetical protein